jgi:hypothetical protein
MVNRIYNLFIFLTLILTSCSNGEKEVELDKNGKAMCASVDECLACYDFERARKLIDHSFGNAIEEAEDTKNITIAESKYWADKGEIDRALTVIDETWGIDDLDWSEADWQSWRYNIIDKGVSSFCEKGDYKQAKILALKAADDINVDGFKIGSGTGIFIDRDGVELDYNPNNGAKEIKAKGPSMQETLLKKINKYEELLK